MQENVSRIETFFPGKKVIVDGQTAKFSINQLNGLDFCRVYEIGKFAKTLNVKRSGTGLTVIFKF